MPAKVNIEDFLLSFHKETFLILLKIVNLYGANFFFSLDHFISNSTP